MLNRQHARGAPIMRVLPTLVGDELRIDQALPDTVAGRDAATEIRGGLGCAVCRVSFQAGGSRLRAACAVSRRRAMTAVGLVDDPSYDAPVEVRARRDGRRHRRAWQ